MPAVQPLVLLLVVLGSCAGEDLQLGLVVDLSLMERLAVEHADECVGLASPEGSECALSALQVHVQGKELPISPALRKDVEGLPLRELGSDELDQLQAIAEEDVKALVEEEKLARLRMEPELASEMVAEGTVKPEAAPNSSNVMEKQDVGASECTSRGFTWQAGNSEICFCQLAHNSACANSGCRCPQGCYGISWQHPHSVSFKNKARANGCWPSTVILTAPRAYFRDASDLKAHGACTVSVINMLLTDAWYTYQQQVGYHPVWHCFHGARIASVKYLHLQTFHHRGNFHGLPSWNHYVAMCVKMYSPSQSWSLAQQVAGMIP